MGERWVIIADDLTGAADCAIAFAKRGLPTTVAWGAHGEPAKPGAVLSYDTNSRSLAAPAAAARQRAALDAFFGPGCVLFKKIDSTLRGQPAAETVVAIEAVRARSGRAFGILAPAFPATGRTVREGRVEVDGAPLEEAEVWRREHSYPSADLLAILASADVAGEKVPLATIRAGTPVLRAALAAIAARGDIVAVCDAETADDLRHLAEASLPVAETTFFVGSAGLAAALAAALPERPSVPPPWPPAGRGSLTVVGSLAAVSRTAARRLAAERGVRHFTVLPAMLLDPQAAEDRDELARQVCDGLESGDVLVELVMDEGEAQRIDSQLVEILATTLAPAASRVGSVVATGGETAAAVLSRFGVHGIRLIDEIEPGVALGLSVGDVSFPVVTKAGAFGGPETLVAIARHLRLIGKDPA